VINRISNGGFQLELLDHTVYHSPVMPLRLSNFHDKVAVGDLLRTVSVGTYAPSSALTDVSTIKVGNWLSQMTITGSEMLVSNNDGNLYVVNQLDGTVEVETTFHLGEVINRIRRYSNYTSKIASPTAIFATVSGGLYVHCRFTSRQDYSELLSVQHNIVHFRKVLNAPFGGKTATSLHNTYRSVLPNNCDVVEGDILSSYSELEENERRLVATGNFEGGKEVSNMSQTEIEDMIRDLSVVRWIKRSEL
jgi:hypothetical protein